MPRTIVHIVLSTMASAGVSALAAADLTVHEIAPGVHAILQPTANRFDDSNSAVVVTARGAIVVDTQVSPAGARAVLAHVRDLTDLPVATVINTHWHGDHVQGNAVYADAFPGVSFIAHRNTRRDIEARAKAALQEELETVPGRLEAAEAQLVSGLRRDGSPLSDSDRGQLRLAIDRRRAHLQRVEEVTFVLPEIVFDERLTLYRGDFEVQLIHFPGHTRGDVVVFLPRQRVLISGDLLDDLPFTGHGSPAALARTLRELEQLDFSHVIPGHGQVRAGKAHLRLVAEMFESIVVHVEAAVAEGKSLENTKQSAELDRFRAMLVTDAASARYWDFFIPEAIARAFEEAGASPEDG